MKLEDVYKMEKMQRRNSRYMEEYRGAYGDIAKVLAQSLSEEEVRVAMEEIHKEFNGTSCSFPKKLYTQEFISRMIVADYEGGMTVKELAKKYDYTEKSIRMVVK